jgi:acetoin utilization deacetylase AcuC-like enzyme
MTLLFTHEAMLSHHVPGGHPESPARLAAVLEGMRDLNLEWRDAPLADASALKRAHSQSHLDLIAGLTPPLDTLISIDADTFVSRGSYEAALRAAGAVVAAVDAVMGGEDTTAFCAVRPPGHHAEPGQAMGFCLFNNVAIGALHALDVHGAARVAVIDFDVHHGNGTQTLAEQDARVFFASTHEWPQYPGTGARSETGLNGNVLNAPLAEGTDGLAWRRIMEREILPAVDAFDPDLILVSAGFDAHAADPLAGLALQDEDFAWGASAIGEVAKRRCGRRVVSTLEGGYDLDALRRSSAAFVSALLRG